MPGKNYDNDGIDFLNALYTNLSNSQSIVTVTPSEYLAKFPGTTRDRRPVARCLVQHRLCHLDR